MSDRIHLNRAALGVCILLLGLFSHPNFSFAQNNTQSLNAETVIERELVGGQTHLQTIGLEAGQYLELSLEQSGAKLRARLVAPDGYELATVKESLWSQTFLKAAIGIVASSAGQHRLELTLTDTSTTKARYSIKVDALRPATAKDAERVQAFQLLAETRELQNQPDAVSRRKSVEKSEQAQAIWHSLNDAAREAETLDEAAFSYYLLGNAAKMDAASQQALKLWQNANRRREEARTLSQFGLLAYVKFEQAKARDYFNQALAIHQETGDKFWQAESLNRLGWVHRSVGDLQLAKDCFLRALPLRREVLYREGESTTLNDLGRVYDELGEKQQAIEHFNLALKLRPAEQNPAGAASVLNRLGITYDSMGERQKALDAYSQALRLSQQSGDRRTEASLLANIGLLQAGLGDGPSALEFYAQGLKLTRELGIRNGEAIILNNLGLVYAAASDWPKAMEHYQQALALHRSVNNRASEAQTLNNLGNLFYQTKDDRKAAEQYNQALAIWKTLGDRRGQATSLLGLGAVSHSQGDKTAARDSIEQALTLYRTVASRAGEIQALRNLAKETAELGDLPKACSLMEEALSLIESSRQNVVSQELRASYFATTLEKYELFIDLLMQSGKPDAALETNERSLARGLLELLGESQADIAQGVSPALLAEARNLQQRLNTRAEAQTRLLNGKHTEAQAAAAAKEISDLTGQYRDVQAQIHAASPRYAALTQPQPLKVTEIQKLLDDDTLLLEFSLGEKASYLWVVTSTAINSHRLPPRAEIENAVHSAYEKLRIRPQRGAPLDKQFSEQLTALSQMLLGPAAAQLAQKRLAIVGSGALAYLPFAALPAPQSKSHQPLMASHEIVNLPSASVLSVIRRETQNRKPASQSLAVIADPVFETSDPRVTNAKSELALSASLTRALKTTNARDGLSRLAFSRQEAEAIYAVAPRGSSFKATDFSASRATATSEVLAQYRFLHFATHGLLNNDQPELSGLVFSLVDEKGQSQDGFLRLHEVFNLKLNAELVTLSACETGLGKAIKGEGLIGLTRGFMYAGTPRVVSSLWNVDDLATAELMKLFYRGLLKEGLRPAAALRGAQQELSRQPRWAAPYFWAGFVLQGEWK